MRSKTKLRQIVHAMLPDPIDSLSGFISEITAIEVTAQEKYVAYVVTVSSPELDELGSFLLTALVGVGVVAGRLGLYQQRHLASAGVMGHHNGIDGDVDA